MCPFCKMPLTKRHGIYIFPLCGMQFIDEENFEDFKIQTFQENLEVKEEYDQHDYTKLSTGLEATFTAFVKVSKDAIMTILGIKDSVLDVCPNKRVVHLAKHGSKKTRKKNFHRAIRILEER